jgi:hypothetical protein
VRRALGIVILLAGCGPKESKSPAEECKTTLVPRPRPTGPESPAPPLPKSSRMVAHVDMKLAPVAAELEKSVPRRVADERGRDIGVAGSLNATVDRGPLATSVEQENLVIRTELRAHAEACAKGRCYASCDPIATATATVPLRLTPDYRFAPSRVTVAFTRGCQIRALGGFVTIDVTPTIQGLMADELRGIERQIDARIPQPRPQVERLWKELNASRELPLGACAIVNPRGLVQGPVRGMPGSVRMRFALDALPELRTRCGDVPPPLPLPKLVHDPQMAEEDDLVVAFVWPLAKVSSQIGGGDPFILDGARVHATTVKAAPAGADVDLDLSVRGEACGDVALRAAPKWSEDGTAIVLGGPRVAPPVQPEALKTMIPSVASSLSDPSFELKATVKEAKPIAAWARGEDLVATVRVRGSIQIDH